MKKEDLENFINSTPQWLRSLADQYPSSFSDDNATNKLASKPTLRIVDQNDESLSN